MSKEFNYQRAWREYVKPEFENLSANTKQLLAQTVDVIDSLKQDRTLALVGQTPELVAAYDAVPIEELAWASQVIYYYGHLAPSGICQSGGLYWKFQKLAGASVINRGEASILSNAKTQMDVALKAYYDHKEGTEYDNEEVGEILAKVILDGARVLKVDNVNHTPDVFCIGPRHFKSDSIYLDPNVAPCARCKRPYSEHKSDRVAFVKVFNPEDKGKIQGALESLKTACETASIKIDGFALVK